MIPVQSSIATTVGVKHSHTELVRAIAATKGLGLDEEHRVIYGTRVIAESLTTLAERAAHEGWIIDLGNSRHIVWEIIPHPTTM